MAGHFKCNTVNKRPTACDPCATVPGMNLNQVRGAARPICHYRQFQLFTRYRPLAC